MYLFRKFNISICVTLQHLGMETQNKQRLALYNLYIEPQMASLGNLLYQRKNEPYYIILKTLYCKNVVFNMINDDNTHIK